MYLFINLFILVRQLVCQMLEWRLTVKDQHGHVLPLNLPTNKMQLCNLTLNK